MIEQPGRFRRGSLLVSVGWLFADLLLVLAVVFLAANTFAPQRPLKARVTVTPTHLPTRTPTPTPSALLLDKEKVRLIITNIDPDKLSQKVPDPGAIADLKQKIKNQIIRMGLQDRRAGIEIAYGGADDFSQADRGAKVAAEVYNILDMLGQQGFVFCHTVHYDPLFTTLFRHDTVVIDIYMFNKSAPNCRGLT